MKQERGRRREKNTRTPSKHGGRRALLWLSLLGLSVAPAWAQQATEAADSPQPRASSVNPTGRDLVLVLPVRFNARLIGGLNTSIAADDTISVQVAELSDLLRARVLPEVLQRIETSGDASGMIGIAALREIAGVELTFNPQSVELDLSLPSSAMAPITIDLLGRDDSLDVESPAPEPFSFALNYRGSWDYVHESSYRDTGLNTPIVDLNVLGRVFDVAYESEFFYDERTSDSLVRQGSRLIYDEPEALRRWTAGDLFVESTAFQAVPDIAGVSLSHLAFDFPNSELAQIRGRQTFSIDRPSRVEILINGQPQLELELSPGFYDLRNFPFINGANDVQVIIEDGTGQRQVLQFDYFLEGTLLAPGQSEYYAAAGVRSELMADEREYYSDDPIATGFYRLGVNDRLTLGVNAQATKTARVAGAEATLAPGVGLMRVSFAGSDIDGVGSGYAARADYRWTFYDEKRLPRSFSALVETHSELFGSVNTTSTPSNPYDYTLAMRYTHGISQSVSASAGVSYSHHRVNEDEYFLSANAGLSWNASSRTRISIGAAYDREPTGEEQVSASIYLSHRFGQRHYANASYDSRDERLSLNYTYLSGGGIGSVDGSASYNRQPTGSSGAAALNYVASRARVGVAQFASADAEDEIVENVTSFRADGAVAFTGGRFALGHSLSDSFVILAPHESLQGAEIEVGDIRNEIVTAKSGALGPALVGVASYTRGVVTYNVPDAPLGYDLGLASVTVRLPLHGANNFTVGSDYNVTVVGILVDYTGAPVALQAGQATSLDDPDAPAVEIFTNRSGRFGGSGLAPGRWRIRLLTGEPLQYDVVIAPAGDTLVSDVGILQPLQ